MNEPETIYQGGCHCGALRFQLRAPDIRRGKRCNCSLCRRRGVLMSEAYFPRSAFLRLEGVETLTVYQFGEHSVRHYFCGICGVYPFHEAVANPGFYRLNLGCIDGLDTLNMEYELIDGAVF